MDGSQAEVSVLTEPAHQLGSLCQVSMAQTNRGGDLSLKAEAQCHGLVQHISIQGDSGVPSD